MALTKDTPRKYSASVDPIFADLPCAAAKTIYEGAAVTDEGGAGTVDNLAASETFLGFAEKNCTNTTAAGFGTAGDLNVHIRQRGVVMSLPVTGVTGNTDLGAAVYATDSGTFTLTSSTAYVQIGKVQAYVTTGYADVYFEAATVRSI